MEKYNNNFNNEIKNEALSNKKLLSRWMTKILIWKLKLDIKNVSKSVINYKIYYCTCIGLNY